MTSKEIQRDEARRRRAALAASASNFANLIARFVDALPMQAADVVASYWPMRDEADPRALAAALASRGHPIVLPRMAVSGTALSFRPWREGDDLWTNRHGVHEPLGHLPAVDPQVLLVPMLAFDSSGTRLGYGRGYYDHALAELRANDQSPNRIIAIGVAYAGQEVAKLVRDAHEERLDWIVTERELRKFG
jgi:5-formyltetrahydrofolate cyclo-ligase